ncbi:hypothetical protein SDC9_137114 [bioreactor metagenome]|uniref:Uncharacterized protein n=1 Tax=bioreactor metagenome TaxID=1076179 RepID=A0A645DLP2_9ZZZZ
MAALEPIDGTQLLHRGDAGVAAGDQCGQFTDGLVRQDLRGCLVVLVGDVIANRPQFANHGLAAWRTDEMRTRRAAPPVGVLGGRMHCPSAQPLELLSGPFLLVGCGQLGAQLFAQLVQELDVECGVSQPVIGNRPS